jgi:hypothetical protein
MTQTPFEIFKNNMNHVGFNMPEKVRMIANKEVSIDDVVNLALSNEQPHARFACWILTHYLDECDKNALNEYVDRAIDFLPYPKHTGQKREILRWLTICKIKTEKLGQLLDFCLEVLPDNSLPIAVKIHAMTIIDNIAKKEPEIIPEFAAIITDMLPYTTVGGDNKINKLLAKYKKQGFLQT